MDCLEGDGHQVAARIILLLLDFGADIEYEQGEKLRSWYEGSIIAIAIQIAISCGSPIELTHPSVGNGGCDGKSDGNIIRRISADIASKKDNKNPTMTLSMVTKNSRAVSFNSNNIFLLWKRYLLLKPRHTRVTVV